MTEKQEIPFLEPQPTEYDGQFQAVNIGLHRRTASRLGAPSLIWHRYFWKPDDLDVLEWHERIGEFLFRFFLGLQQLKFRYPGSTLSCPNYDGKFLYTFQRFWCPGDISDENLDALRGSVCFSEPLNEVHQPSMQNVFACDLSIADVKFSFRATLQTEFWTIEFATDVSRSRNTTARPFPELKRAFESINSTVETIISRYNQKPSGAAETSVAEPDDLHEGADEDIVVQYKHFCRRILLTTVGVDESHRCYHSIVDGTVFGDFVGIVLGLQTVGKAVLAPENGHEARFPLRVVDYGVGRMPIPDRNPLGAALTVSDATRLIDAMWPFIKKVQRSGLTKGDEHFEYAVTKPEYTASLFQRGRLLYLSALGKSAVGIAKDSTEEAYPNVYVAVCVHPNRWQLGRVIDKIHELGALRLAAVRDFNCILDGGRNLSVTRSEIATSGADIQKIGRDLNAIENSVVGGLQHRLERGRYYIDRFRRLAESLEINRLEGFQPYQHFVERRLSDKFSSIEYVGRIYYQTGRAYRSLINLGLQNTISRQIDGTTDLLEAAEKISVLPLTYYLGTIALHIVEQAPWFEKFHTEATIGAFIGSGLVVVCSIMFLSGRRKTRNLKKLTSLIR